MNSRIGVKVAKFLVASGFQTGHVTQRMRNGHFVYITGLTQELVSTDTCYLSNF